jgi:hypothetical protein
MPHLTFNPPPYRASAVLFHTEPDANGCVDSEPTRQAREAVTAFGHIDERHHKFTAYFLKTFSPYAQVRDIADHFPDLTVDQRAAVAKGTAELRFLNVAPQSLPALTKDGATARGVAFAGPGIHGGGATFADPASVYAGHCADFQHNLNVGADGTKTGTGVDKGL